MYAILFLIYHIFAAGLSPVSMCGSHIDKDPRLNTNDTTRMERIIHVRGRNSTIIAFFFHKQQCKTFILQEKVQET